MPPSDGTHPTRMSRATAVVPARGGSRSVPEKNLQMVEGKSLLQWTIECARASTRVDRILVSTDHEGVAAEARRLGAEVPFIRPAQLAQDTTPMVDVVLHLANELTLSEDLLVLLQPTSPCRLPEDIDASVDLLVSSGAPAVISVVKVAHHPTEALVLDQVGRIAQLTEGHAYTRRQDLPDSYAANGAVFAIRLPDLKEHATFTPPGTLAYVMPADRSIDIDEPWQLEVASALIRRTIGAERTAP